MSLQGTLETIPLPDVLALLAATKKTGELRITGARGDGRLWLDTGRVVAADVPRATTPVDAVFELLRLSAGSFAFGDGAPSAGPGEPIAVDALLIEAQQRLSAWLAIEAVVPSMACTLRLTPDLSHDSVTVTRQQWKELVAVAAGGDVNGAMKGLAVGEFDTCRTVKELVDAGLVQVGKAPAAPAAPASSNSAPDQQPPAPSGRDQSSARAERPAPGRRPAPTAAPATARATSTGPVDPTRAASASGTHSSAAPAAAANGGRSAAPRRGTSPVPGREEAEEMVQQLASLGAAPAGPAVPTRADAGLAAAAKDDADRDHNTGDDAHAEGKADEPINRGMLLKFLSSVRP